MIIFEYSFLSKFDIRQTLVWTSSSSSLSSQAKFYIRQTLIILLTFLSRQEESLGEEVVTGGSFTISPILYWDATGRLENIWNIFAQYHIEVQQVDLKISVNTLYMEYVCPMPFIIYHLSYIIYQGVQLVSLSSSSLSGSPTHFFSPQSQLSPGQFSMFWLSV